VTRGRKGQQNPTQPDPKALRRRRLGLIVHWLRVQQGWLRRQLGQRAGLADSEIHRLEAGTYMLTAAAWQRLLQALQDLQRQVAEAGIEVELAPEPGLDSGKEGT